MARPAFFRMTIWIDVVAFGPFYAFAIYAFIRGREWIRVPALVWSGVMMTNVAIILFEETHRRVTRPRTSAWCSAPTCRGSCCRSPSSPGSERDHPFSRFGVGAGRPSLVTGMRDLARYGPWALVAGASEGIGAAFATALIAAAGLNVVLVARRREPLAALAASLHGRRRSARSARSRPTSAPTRASRRSSTRPSDLEIGLVVANAAYAPIGSFLDIDLARLRQAIDLNCAAPLRLARHYLPAMAQRGRGGFVIMSSLAGQQGSPGITTYAATKAFGAVLAEGLWAEMRPHGVDVLACAPGAVETPGLAASKSRRAPGTVDAGGGRHRGPGGAGPPAADRTRRPDEVLLGSDPAGAAPARGDLPDREGVQRSVLAVVPGSSSSDWGTSRTSTPPRRATNGTRPPCTMTEKSTTTKMTEYIWAL